MPTCPNCIARIPSWRFYLEGARGARTCANCGARFRVMHRPVHFVLLAIVCVGLFVLLGRIDTPAFPGLLVALVVLGGVNGLLLQTAGRTVLIED